MCHPVAGHCVILDEVEPPLSGACALSLQDTAGQWPQSSLLCRIKNWSSLPAGRLWGQDQFCEAQWSAGGCPQQSAERRQPRA